MTQQLLQDSVDLLIKKNEELANLRRGVSFKAIPQSSYDYIVVGAGASGCVVAARLSEDPEVIVLLLEAGTDQRANIDVNAPTNWNLIRATEHNWHYFTEPQTHAAGRKVLWPIGKMIGGSCAHNAMKYVRGTRGDYDDWAETYECKGWSSDECYRYFKKSEGNLQPGLSSEYHNNYGPLKVSSLDRHPIAEAYRRGCIDCGIPENNDYNADPQIGVSGTLFTIGDGKRCSSADAFITPAENRTNLDIVTGAHVTRAIVSDSTKTCTGVEFRLSSEESNRTVVASQEVILSACAINTPQLLMLSGIGEKTELEKHGIKCINNLPAVGKHLRDHIVAATQFESNYPSEADPTSPESYAEYLLHRTGPLLNLGLEVNAFYNTGVRKDLIPRGQSDIQLATSVRGLGNHLGDNVEESGTQMFLVYPILLHPVSNGYVTLKSSDPFDPPIMDPKYLEAQEDVDSMMAGMKKLKEVLQTDHYKNLNVKPIIPKECAYEWGTTECDDWIIRNRGTTAYHPMGTCRMGPYHRGDTVVDPELRVHGIKNLRVIDNSISPQPPSGNTMAMAIMIGEKGADLLKQARTKNRSSL